MHDPIAYTYEADTHCPACTENRFGRGDDGFIASDSTDSESNPVGVIAPWDEWVSGAEGCEFLTCGTCLGEIESAHVDVFGEATSEGDDYDACKWEVDDPVIVRDIGGSIPRTSSEWVETILADAASLGVDVSTLERDWEALDNDQREEFANDFDNDVSDAINASTGYVVVENSDAGSWVVYRRKGSPPQPEPVTLQFPGFPPVKGVGPVIEALELDDFARGYLEAALWVNDPSPGSGEYQADLSRVPRAYLLQALTDCREFQRSNQTELAHAGSAAQNGHDFYLTRNHHGAGFWDRGYLPMVGKKLTAAAHAFGSTESEDVQLFANQEG